MKPFAYLRVDSAEAAVKALAKAGPEARVIAGGTTLYDLMKLDIMAPPVVIDILRARDMSAIEIGDKEIRIGALTPMSRVADEPRIRQLYPALAESLSKAASQQLRNMATVGGNLLQRTRCLYFRGGEPFPCNKRQPGSGCAAVDGLDRAQALFGASEHCNAVFPSDWAIALTAFDAQIDTLSPRGRRSLAVESLHREPGSTPQIEHALAADEIITRIRIPTTALGRASTYHKLRDRESYAFALASAAVALNVSQGQVTDARICLGGVATRPWRVRQAEEWLKGKAPTPENARRAGEIAFEQARTGHHNKFRVELGIRTVADAILIANERAVRA